MIKVTIGLHKRPAVKGGKMYRQWQGTVSGGGVPHVQKNLTDRAALERWCHAEKARREGLASPQPNSTRTLPHPLLAYTRRRADNNDFGARAPFVRPATEVVPKQRAYMEDPRVRPKLDALESMGVLYEFKGPHVTRQELDGWFGQEISARAQKMKPHALVVTHHIGRSRIALYREHGIYVYYYPVKWEE